MNILQHHVAGTSAVQKSKTMGCYAFLFGHLAVHLSRKWLWYIVVRLSVYQTIM